MKLLALDFETWGIDPAFALQPFRALSGAAWLTSYAAAVRDSTGRVRLSGGLQPTREQMRKLLVAAKEQGLRIVCWNAPFDAAWLLAMGLRDEVFACKWLDAMLLYRHIEMQPLYIPNHVVPAYGLKAAVARFYPDEAGYEEDIDFGATDPDQLAKLLVYNKDDTRHTLNLAHLFLGMLSPEQIRCALIEADSIPLIAETSLMGIEADGYAAVALAKKLEDEAKVAFITLKMSEGGEDITPKVLASPTQLREVLFEKWRLPVQGMTDTGKPSTDKEALGRLGLLDPRAKLLHTYREANNGRTKYCVRTMESLAYNGDGRVRPGARIYGTYTGRLTYASKQGKGKAEVQTGVALHQWKRGKEYRNLLRAPEGYTLIEHDFAGQEFKWMAVESGDPTMLRLCEPGEDPHSFMSSRIEPALPYRELMRRVALEEAEAKKTRQLGKVANLSLQYRTSWRTLMLVAWCDHGVVLTEIEAQRIHATYKTTYIQVPQYWRRQISFAKTHGYAETLGGRRIQLGTGDVWDKETTWSRESTAINFPIQGVGADQKYLALKVLKDFLPSVDGRFAFELHDGMFTIVPDAKAEKAAHDMKYLLSNLPYKQAWGKQFPILFPVDAKTGKSWGTLKDLH